MKKPVICILVESFQREIEVKLYMALRALKRDYQVVIAEQNTPVSRHVKDCVVMNKDHARWSEVFFKKKESRNIIACALDEEALIIGDKETYLNSRVSNKVIDSLDAVFAWGAVHRNIMTTIGVKEDKIIVTGAPKFDLAKLYHNGDRKLGSVKSILLNTRFSYTNSNAGSVDSIVHTSKRLGYISSEEDLIRFNKMVNSEYVIQSEFDSLIELIGMNSGIKLTVRPHPAESESRYLEYSNRFENVTVDRISDLRVQMREHDCVVHDGCTTAIEANAIGVPVFGLRPKNLEEAYDDYANKYSYNFTSALDLYDYLVSTPVNKLDVVDMGERVKDEIFNWGQDGGSATERILDAIDGLDPIKVPLFKPTMIMRIDWKSKLFNVMQWSSLIRLVVKSLVADKYESFISGYELSDKKFQDVSSDDISDLVKDLCKVDSELSCLDVKTEQVGRKSYLLYDLKSCAD